MALTERQQEVVDCIRTFWKTWGYGPSLQDIADSLTISRPTVLEAVQRLVEKGILEYTPGKARSTRLSDSTKS